MSQETYNKMIDAINDVIIPISKQNMNFNFMLDKIADSRFVLIGEATHGTEEFYKARIEISKLLIEKKGFMAIAIEGDWPNAYAVHRYIRGVEENSNSVNVLEDFKNFPTWMWRNTTIPPFIQWLKSFNENNHKIGFYGLDIYSLYSSMNAVIQYLSKVDPLAAEKARKRYACFETVNTDPQQYGYLTSLGVKKSCIKEAVDQLLEMQHHAFLYLRKDNITEEDDYFYATQNARLVKNAERYYRSIFEDHVQSWNIRDNHMAETVSILADHLENIFKRPAKIIIWAHNSHLGDARATEAGSFGEVNLGQLIRETHENTSYHIGFSTYRGTVTAANDWDEPTECKQVSNALEGSYEALFHHLKYKNFLLDLRTDNHIMKYLEIPRLQRAIGVIYRPETERESHYFMAKLPYQFDCMIHFDESSAVKPLDS